MFAPITAKQNKESYILEVRGTKIEITQRQYQYFEHLMRGHSINKTVLDFIDKGWLVSFRDIFSLIEILVQQRWISNPEIQAYFEMARDYNASGIQDLERSKGRILASPEAIKKFPFFRTLPADILKLFINHTKISEVPANTRICKTGENSRELYAMISGTLGIYRIFPDQKRQLISTVPAESIFGEGGFLLGKPRGADVISLQPTTVAVIEHIPEFEAYVDSGKAEALQQRFWVLQGLLASQVFSHVPTETLDSLVFAGKIIRAKPGDVFTQEGDPGTCFYIVVQGTVTFTKKGRPLRSLSQGGIFGEVALMVSGGKRTATAQAQTESILLQIDMREFYTILSNHLILAKEIENIAWNRWQSEVTFPPGD